MNSQANQAGRVLLDKKQKLLLVCEAKIKKERLRIKLEEELRQRRQGSNRQLLNNAIVYYVAKKKGNILYGSAPHTGQVKFHADKSRVRVVEGGNRSGKSVAGINEDVAHCLGYRPWLASNNPSFKVDIDIPNKGLVIGESFTEQVKKVLVPKLLGDYEKGIPAAIPRHEIESTKKNQQGVIVLIRFKNGSTIDFQSYDQNIDLFESTDYDWIHYDEPPPRAVWVATQRGLTDRNGKCWLTMTPLKEAWIFDEIISGKVGDVGVHRFDIEDNCGYGLTREGIDSFAATLTDDEKEARLRGRFFHLVGLVYKSYGEIHQIPRIELDPLWNIWMHVDTHPRTPHHAVWIAIRPDNSMIVIGELKNSDPNNRVEPFCAAVESYEVLKLGLTNEQRRNNSRLMEPGASTPNPVADGLSIMDEFKRCGIKARPGSKNRDAGILFFQQALKHDRNRGVTPLVYFFDDLRGIHFEMTHYVWDEFKGKMGEGRALKQIPKDKDDHFIEGIHRILLAGPRYRNYILKKRNQLIRPVDPEVGW